MRKNILRGLWLFILLLCMFKNGFAESRDVTFVIKVCTYGSTLESHCGDDVETFPDKKPRHAPSNKGERVLLEVFFNDAYEDISISIFKDGCNVVYEDGIAVFPEGSLKYDLAPYGHGSYYICIKNGSAVLHDEKVEL